MSVKNELARIQKEIKAPKDKNNNFGNYKYRTAEGIFSAAKKVMSEGAVLTLSDEIVLIGDRYYIKASATFQYQDEAVTVCGWAREADNKKGMDLSQLTGATSSYARKYAAAGLFAVDDEDDADSMAPEGRATAMPKAVGGGGTVSDVIAFGKFKGKRYSQVPVADLKSYANWLKKQEANPLTTAFIKTVEGM